MSSCVEYQEEEVGEPLQELCEVVFVFFELMWDEGWEFIEGGKQRKKDMRVFILGLVYFWNHTLEST